MRPARRPRPGTSPRIWSVTSATTARSWLTNTRLTPESRRISPSRARICACTETSSADTASSSTSTAGSTASALAIATRCRWPPLSWCGRDAACELVEPDAVQQVAHVRRGSPARSRPAGAGAGRRAARPRRSAAGRASRRGPGTPSAPRGPGPSRAFAAPRPVHRRSRPLIVTVPASGTRQSDDHPGHRGLAGAGLADQPERAALRHGEADVLGRRDRRAAPPGADRSWSGRCTTSTSVIALLLSSSRSRYRQARRRVGQCLACRGSPGRRTPSSPGCSSTIAPSFMT